jgi:transposase
MIIRERLKIIEFFEEFGEEATKRAFDKGRSTIYLWKQKINQAGGYLSALKTVR